MIYLVRSVAFTSVEPVAIAVTFEVCGSISTWTSIDSGVAPDSIALFIASFFNDRISSLLGEGMIRSTTSQTIASATPIEEITSAFSGIEYFTPILLLK